MQTKYNQQVRKLKYFLMSYTPIERLFREATNSEKCDPNKAIMQRLLHETLMGRRQFSELIDLLSDRLQEPPKNYVHIYKTLVVLEYLVRDGCECMAVFWTRNRDVIDELRTFELRTWIEDKGVCVRRQASVLMDLLDEPDRLLDGAERPKCASIMCGRQREHVASIMRGLSTPNVSVLPGREMVRWSSINSFQL